MPKAPLFLVKAQDTKNQSKPRAAGRSTVDQFRYFGSDCINYSNRSQIPSREIPLVAFLSHIQLNLAESARAAGCRDVMPRSKFTQNMATILARAKSES